MGIVVMMVIVFESDGDSINGYIVGDEWDPSMKINFLMYIFGDDRILIIDKPIG